MTNELKMFAYRVSTLALNIKTITIYICKDNLLKEYIM